MQDLFDTNWESLLLPEEKPLIKEDGNEFHVVLLAGLQRLARLAGISSQRCEIFTPANSVVQAVFYTTFNTSNGLVTFVGTADSSSKNTSDKYFKYPTAVAESRAEARCLRKALGIKLLSSEEIGFREGIQQLEVLPSALAESSLIAAIEKLCENKNIEPIAVIETVIEDKNRVANIFQLSELTTQEAQKALAWLNEQKPKKLTTAELRKNRKEELQKELDVNETKN